MAQGSIYKRTAKDGSVSWWVMVDIGDDPVTGKRRQRKRTFRTKREAEAGLATWLADLERGTAVDPSRMTVGEYLWHWLETSARGNVRPSTYRRYEGLLRVNAMPRVGSIPLQRLTAMQVQQMYTDLLNGPRADLKAGKLSGRTVRHVHVVFKEAIKQAVRWRLVPHNVVEDVDPPTVRRPQIEVWDAGEAQAFLEAATGDVYGAIWPVALHTGLRKGELLALRWCDVDLDRGLLHVRQAASETWEGLDVDEPKTRSGRRTISLPPSCLAALCAHKAARPKLPVPLDPAKRDTGLVFCSGAGTPIEQRNLTRQFDRLVRRAGLRRISFHGLRHTHATLLLLAGVNIKAVSARLGHASIQVTLDYYGHLLPRMEEQAAQAIEAALARCA